MRALCSLLLLGLSCPLVLGQDPAVRRIQEKFAAEKPTEKELAFYRLDWTTDLSEAKTRARKEGRPICFVWVTNITAACNFFSGHC